MEDFDSLDDYLLQPEMGFDELSWLRASPHGRGEPPSIESSMLGLIESFAETTKPRTLNEFGDLSNSETTEGFVEQKLGTSQSKLGPEGSFGDILASSQMVLGSRRSTHSSTQGSSSSQKSSNFQADNSNEGALISVNKRNAEACRRNRLKRKADEENLRKRNEELEGNRGFFLERIAELQFQVDALRMAGSIDLRKENEFLRKEIALHKSYLDDMVKAVKKHPKILLEERARLIKTFLNDSVAHVVGLAYSSAGWQYLHTTRHGIFSMRMHYDVLPKNVPLSEVKRINIRCELLNAPAGAKAFHNFVSSLWHDQGRMRRYKEALQVMSEADWNIDTTNMSSELKEALSALPTEDNVRIATCTEYENNRIQLQTTMSACSAKQNLVPRALFAKDDKDAERDLVIDSMTSEAKPAFIHAITNCDQELAEAKVPTPYIAPFKFTNGHVIVPHDTDPNSCHVVAVSTVPIGTFPTLRTPADMFTKDGLLTDMYIESFSAQLEFFMEEVTAFCEAHAYNVNVG